MIRTNLALVDFEFTSNYTKRIELQILYKNADKNGFPTMEERIPFNDNLMLSLNSLVDVFPHTDRTT